MAQDWYPSAFSDRVPWHANFAANAQATGATYGLSAADIADIAADAGNVALAVNFKEAVDAYRQAVTEWAEIVLEGEPGAPFPPPPAPPAEPGFAPASKPAIEARTRLYAGIVKADANYTPIVGENYGIVAPEAPPGEVAIASLEALSQSQVRVRVRKAGHETLALDSRRGGGPWEQLLVLTRASYVDVRPPLASGQPEAREYRCQAYRDNQRVGPVSPVETVVTTP
jgi:hypothetical protein